ncbi:MAG: LLM class flavin-dependent oxidoreductase [Chloroflexi bacterium]|nr:LLM class flavin-dependent oxidoreductase [Chloroflexota bacterium]
MNTVPASYAAFLPSARATLATIEEAEAIGVPAIWGPTAPMMFDMLTLLAAAAVCTSQIRLGAAIVPTYPRHPITVALETVTVAELAPGRFQLGLGSSHPFVIEGVYGLPFGKPVTHLREYMTIVRALLWEGAIDFEGEYFQAHAQLPPGVEPPCIPIPVAALRPPLFRLAGELSDGALAAWCPYAYLFEHAFPAMREGAATANRPVPPLFAQAPVVFHDDLNVVREVARQALIPYTSRAPAYIKMFAMAGYTIGPDGLAPDDLIDDMFVWGDDATILERLSEIRAMGIDELMVTLHPVGDPMAEQTRLLHLISEFARHN